MKKQISFADGRGPYIYARYTIGADEYEFEHGKEWKGTHVLKTSRRWLKKRGLKDARLISLEQEVKGKINTVDYDEISGTSASRYGPWWRILFQAEKYKIAFVVDEILPAESYVKTCHGRLYVQGARFDINLLRIRHEKPPPKKRRSGS